jgi:hypothetical protein
MRLLVVLLLLAASTAGAQVRNDSFRVFTVHAPPSIARVDTLLAQAASWGGQPPDGGITARLVHVTNAAGQRTACEPITNAAEVAGQMAVIARGDCEFGFKALMAQEAGAAAFLVYNRPSGSGQEDPIVMGPGVYGHLVSIAGGFLTIPRGRAIADALNSGAVATATLTPYFAGPVASEPPLATGSALRLAVSPNPSSDAIALTLEAARAGVVRVAVYDALGREVAAVHDGPLVAGVHRFSWEAAGLAPGLYVIRASNADATATVTLTSR